LDVTSLFFVILLYCDRQYNMHIINPIVVKKMVGYSTKKDVTAGYVNLTPKKRREINSKLLNPNKKYTTIIQSKIYEIRGVKVMLDFDLAEMYGVETSVLKQSARHNMKYFEGDDFMFEVTMEELSRSQIVILNKGHG